MLREIYRNTLYQIANDKSQNPNSKAQMSNQTQNPNDKNYLVRQLAD